MEEKSVLSEAVIEDLLRYHPLTERHIDVLKYVYRDNTGRTPSEIKDNAGEKAGRTYRRAIRELIDFGFLELGKMTELKRGKPVPVYITPKARAKIEGNPGKLYYIVAVFLKAGNGKRLLGLRKTTPIPNKWGLPFKCIEESRLREMSIKTLEDEFEEFLEFGLNIYDDCIYDDRATAARVHGFDTNIRIYEGEVSDDHPPRPDDLVYACFEFMEKEEYFELHENRPERTIESLIESVKEGHIKWD